jgi:hypothetical protein
MAESAKIVALGKAPWSVGIESGAAQPVADFDFVGFVLQKYFVRGILAGSVEGRERC